MSDAASPLFSHSKNAPSWATNTTAAESAGSDAETLDLAAEHDKTHGTPEEAHFPENSALDADSPILQHPALFSHDATTDAESNKHVRYHLDSSAPVLADKRTAKEEEVLANMKIPETSRPYPVPALPTAQRDPEEVEALQQGQVPPASREAQVVADEEEEDYGIYDPRSSWRGRTPFAFTNTNGTIRPIRHIHIKQPSQSIKGSHFSISPYAPDPWPPRFDAPSADVTSKSRASSVMESRGSAVNVKVFVETCLEEVLPQHEAWDLSEREVRRRLREVEEKMPRSERIKPVMITAKSYMSYVNLVVPNYPFPTIPLHIRAKSHNGNVSVYLPPQFSGLLSWNVQNGHHQRDSTSASGSTEKGRISSLTLHPSSLANPKEIVTNRYIRISKYLRESGRVVEVGANAGVGKETERQVTKETERKHKGILKIQPLEMGKWGPTRSSFHSQDGSVAASSGRKQQLRGDICELITTRGVIHVYDASEEEGASSSTSCSVM